MGRLAEAADAREQRRRGPACGVRTLLETLDTDDAADLQDMLRGTKLNATTIRDILKDELGVEIHADKLRYHRWTLQGRPGGCACPV